MDQKGQNSPGLQTGRSLQAADRELGVLLKACAAGEQTALKSLYRHTSAELFAVVLRMVKIPAVAEDVLRDTYVTVWRRAHDYSTSALTPISWLIQIARRLARLRIQSASYTDELKLTGGDATSANPEVYFARLQQHPVPDALPHTLRQLSAEARYLILLAYCDGSSLSTLSQQLNIDEGEARQLVQQGLAAMLQEDKEDEN